MSSSECIWQNQRSFVLQWNELKLIFVLLRYDNFLCIEIETFFPIDRIQYEREN
jgi:hypothetical protein